MAQPKNPAAVSGPGKLARRTDGGAGSKKQPIRVPTGGKYGEAKALKKQQQSAPMAKGGPKTPAPQPKPTQPQQPQQNPGTPAEGASMPVPQGGVFGPTEQPGAPQAQAHTPRQIMAENPQLMLRVLYSEFPTPALAALLRRTGTNG